MRINGGYAKCTIRDNTRYLHRLIMEAHIGPCPLGFVVRHLDDNKLNNTVLNLVYGTYRDNRLDRLRAGTYAPKLTPRKIHIIRGLHRLDFSQERLGAMFGVHPSHICKIIRGVKWQNVPIKS